MKVCGKCKVEKELIEFSKNQYRCKSCVKEYAKEYYKNNAEKIKEYTGEYQKNNAEKIKEYHKEYSKNNKEKIKEYYKEYSKNNLEKLKECGKEYYKKNKSKIIKYSKQRQKDNALSVSEYQKKYQKDNAEKLKEKRMRYQKNNKEQRKKYAKEYKKNRKKTDHLFRMISNLRSRTSTAFKARGWHKNGGTEQMLGCDWKTAHNHLEKQFTKGMCWENYGDWHLDHKIPLSSAKTEQDFINLCYYTNLQPLWAFDNISKGDKINGQQTFLPI